MPTEILTFFVGLIVGGTAIYYQGRADRRDAARFRREMDELARAAIRVEADYPDGLIILHNDGPADAHRVRITEARCGPRSRVSDAREVGKWHLPAEMPADTSVQVRIVPKEAIGDWIDLTLEWENANGSARRRKQRIMWAG